MDNGAKLLLPLHTARGQAARIPHESHRAQSWTAGAVRYHAAGFGSGPSRYAVALPRRNSYGYGMTVGEIKVLITNLSDQERAELAEWLLSLDREAWDRQIEADFSPGGKGIKLLEEVDSAIDRGDFKPLG